MTEDRTQTVLVVKIELSRGEILVAALHAEAALRPGHGVAPPAVRGHGPGPGLGGRHPGNGDPRRLLSC